MTNPNPSSDAVSFPTFTHLLNWRVLGRILAGLGVLITLVALFYAEENWRGRRAWNRYKTRLEAEGIKLDWRDYVPRSVPDDQNFAMTPFLAPLFDFNPPPRKPGQSLWRDTNAYNRTRDFVKELEPSPFPGWTAGQWTDLSAAVRHVNATAPAPANRTAAATELLRFLTPYEPVFSELRTASQRPYARFNINYDDEFAPSILLPHLVVVKRANLAFQLRASAELALDQTNEAWSDLNMALNLSDAIAAEPFIVDELVRDWMVQNALQPLWEGLAQRKWTDAQLKEMELRLEKTDLLTDKTMQGDLAFGVLTLSQLRNQPTLDLSDSLGGFLSVRPCWLPSGWFCQNQLTFARLYRELILPVVDIQRQRAYPDRAAQNAEVLRQVLRRASVPNPYRLMVEQFFQSDQFSRSESTETEPGLMVAERKFVAGQTRINEAMVACALERYRRANGRFPEALHALSPQFLANIPPDLITGEPLKYRRTDDGQFILYSVGWNQQDDGGTVVMIPGKKSTPDYSQGDWVWEFPKKN